MQLSLYTIVQLHLVTCILHQMMDRGRSEMDVLLLKVPATPALILSQSPIQNMTSLESPSREKRRRGKCQVSSSGNPGADRPQPSGGDKRGCTAARVYKRRRTHHNYGGLTNPKDELRDLIYTLAQVCNSSSAQAVVEAVVACAGFHVYINPTTAHRQRTHLENAVIDILQANGSVSHSSIAYIIACINFTSECSR